MRTLLSVLLAFVLLVIESPLLHELHLSFYAPDFALIVVVYMALGGTAGSGAVGAMIIGLFKDAFAGGSPIGLYMHTAVALYLLTRAVAAHLNLRPVFLSMAGAFVASIVASGFFLLLTLIFDRTFDDYGLIVRMAGPQALVTAPFAPILFLVLEKIDGLTVRRRSGTIFFK